jgi:hypothetical protein
MDELAAEASGRKRIERRDQGPLGCDRRAGELADLC